MKDKLILAIIWAIVISLIGWVCVQYSYGVIMLFDFILGIVPSIFIYTELISVFLKVLLVFALVIILFLLILIVKYMFMLMLIMFQVIDDYPKNDNFFTKIDIWSIDTIKFVVRYPVKLFLVLGFIHELFILNWYVEDFSIKIGGYYLFIVVRYFVIMLVIDASSIIIILYRWDLVRKYLLSKW